MSKVVAACVAAFLFTAGSSVFAQIIYQPVTYQYSSGGSLYYYGGSNPQVHAEAQSLSQETSFGRSNGYAFHSATIDTHREVVHEPARVYTDMIPFQNAHFFGYTANDARNAAYASAATYFRKADALRAAEPQRDGTWVVPVQADGIGHGTIEIRPWKPAAAPAVTPVIEPKPLLIIPKHLLDKPLWPSNNPTADAR
jgi:hypothetical protein